MKRFWRIVEIAAYVAFFACIGLIWVSMLGDYHRVTYDVPGSLGLLVSVLVAGIARHKRGATDPFYY